MLAKLATENCIFLYVSCKIQWKKSVKVRWIRAERACRKAASLNYIHFPCAWAPEYSLYESWQSDQIDYCSLKKQKKRKKGKKRKTKNKDKKTPPDNPGGRFPELPHYNLQMSSFLQRIKKHRKKQEHVTHSRDQSKLNGKILRKPKHWTCWQRFLKQFS